MATRHQSDYRTLSSISRINLLHELQQKGPQSIAELAEATGLHHNTAREHLHRLIDAGFVDSEPIPSETKGRPKIRYRAARGAESPSRKARLASADRRTELIHKLLPLKDVSTEYTDRDRQLDVLDDHMDQCGFDAEFTRDGSRMTMHDCPFSGLAKDHPQVCQVHYALVKDALDDGGGPLHATELRPFTSPTTCTVDFEDSSAAGR